MSCVAMCSREESYTSIKERHSYRSTIIPMSFHYPQNKPSPFLSLPISTSTHQQSPKAGRPSPAPKLLPGPPALQRAISAKTPKTAGAAPQLMRAVSGGSHRPQAMGFSPTLMMGSSDPRFGQKMESQRCFW